MVGPALNTFCRLLTGWCLGAGLLQTAVAQDPPPAPVSASTDQQRFADGLLSRGLNEMAIEEYRRILADDPEYARLDEVLFRLGEAYRKLKQDPAAERMYLRVVKEFPESQYREMAAFRRAELYVRNGKHLQAISLMRTLAEANPEPKVAASAAYYAGYSLKQIALLEEAEEQFKTVIEKYPESDYQPFAALELASMYRQKPASREEAEKMYARVVSSGASERMRAEALFQMGDLAYGARDFEGAVKAYTALRTEFPADPRAAEAALQSGWAYFLTQRWEELLALSAEEEREDPVWQYFRANSLRANKEYAEAMGVYQVFLSGNPDHRLSPAARYEEALCAFSEKDYERVVTRLNEGSWSGSVAVDRAWILAQAYLRLNRAEDAGQTLESFLSLEPEGSRATSARYELARFAQVQGKLEEAAAMYRSLVQENPEHPLAPKALYAAGFCMAARDDFHQAVKDWEALQAAYPEAGEITDALFQKALAQIRLETFPSAEGTLNEYLKRTPGKEQEVEALYWLGQVHEKKSEPEKARDVYQSALNQASGHARQGSLRLRLAGVVQSLGDADAAAALYQQVLDSPDVQSMSPSLMEWLVRQNLDRQQGPQAVQAARAMVAASEDEAWKQIAYFLLGKSEALNGDASSSRSAYETAFDMPGRTPEGVEAGLELGLLLLEAGDGPNAAEVLSRVVDRSREDSQLAQRAKATFLLGRASEMQEDFKSAARYYMSMAILYDDPELSPEALYRAAAAYGESGSTKEQQSAVQELKTRYPDSSWANKSE